jgi:hypothetical protein
MLLRYYVAKHKEAFSAAKETILRRPLWKTELDISYICGSFIGQSSTGVHCKQCDQMRL